MKKISLFMIIAAALITLVACGAATDNITLNTDDVQKTFNIDETFTSEGLVVIAHLSNGAEKEISLDDCEISTPDMSSAGLKSVNVIYDGTSATYKISVVDSSLPNYFQFTGYYDELASFDILFEFYMELKDDNTGIVYQGQGQPNGDTVNVSETELTWSIEKDRDGIVAMTIRIGGIDHVAYQETDGSFKINYHFKFNGGQNSRDVELVGQAVTQFTSIDAWKEYAIEQFVTEIIDPGETKTVSYNFGAEAGTVIQVSSEQPLDNTGAEVLLYDDGTVYARTGYAVGTTVYSTYKELTGTWTMGTDDVLTIVINSVEYVVSLTDGVYSFTWNLVQDQEGAVSVIVKTSAAE